MTVLDYHLDSYLFSSENSAVVSCEATEGSKFVVVLDRTIFYAQSGGQPGDAGTIVSLEKDTVFEVVSTRFGKDGSVEHVGSFVEGSEFVSDEKVKCSVKEESRLLNCRLHTAGHLIDSAVANLGFDWATTKGYHFPKGAYVEYKGFIEAADRDSVRENLEKEINRLIEENKDVVVYQECNLEQVKEICGLIPPYITGEKPARVVKVDNTACCCGGTHVRALSEVQPLTVRKLKVKGGKNPSIRVSYALAGEDI
eukprot:GCRY01000940.1.p1 GENE.GCRY01000940.1~~GCRY01000940.1.p1  ORF type:complete len:254 (+),score=73.05 GCRY01000940.1:119-880(+)